MTLSREKNARHSLERNWGPRSETISSGIPKFWKTCSKSISAVSKAVGRARKGINLQALENRSMATRMQVFPSETGRSVTKSTPI